jgi:hypothetical protein
MEKTPHFLNVTDKQRFSKTITDENHPIFLEIPGIKHRPTLILNPSLDRKPHLYLEL